MENEKNGRRNFIYFLLSILVACGVWLYSDLTGGPNGGPRTTVREFQDIPIEYFGEATLADRGLMLLEEGSDLTIDLKLEGTRWTVSNLDRSQIRVTVNLANVIEAGSQSLNYLLSYTDRKYNNAFEYEASINNATVNISELYSQTVDVSCELVGNVAEGYTAGQVELSHTSIEIRGLAEDIDPIRYAKVTLDIGSEAEETVSQELAVQYYDGDGNLVDSSGIHSAVDMIQATLPVYVTKELRLTVNFIDAPGARFRSTEARIDPETITVSGDATMLKNVETLELGDFKLLDLGTTASQNYTTTYYPIILPEGYQNLSGITRAALRIRFTDMTNTTVSTDNIILRNLPEGKRAEVLTGSLPVRIYGTAANVAAVTAEHISVTVDLTDYSAASGTYTIPAEVSVAIGDVGIQGEYQIQVTIRETQDEPPEPDPAEPQGESEGEGP